MLVFKRVRSMQLGLLFGVTFVRAFIAQGVTAHDLAHRWYTLTIVLADTGTSYRASITSTTADYDLHTDLVASRNDSTSALGVVYYMQGNYGASYDPAWAMEYRNGLSCKGAYVAGRPEIVIPATRRPM